MQRLLLGRLGQIVGSIQLLGALRRCVPRGWVFRVAFSAVAVASLYWGAIASDRYVSEADVLAERTDLASSASSGLASLLIGGQGNSDLHVLRKYLLSVDMLARLESKFSLRAHYSDRRRDLLSRMWFADAPAEWFYSHYLSRVSADIDDSSGTLHLRVQAYSPQTARDVTRFLVSDGERYMNEIVHRVVSEQVGFLERQVERMKERLINTRAAVLAYQDANGMVSPLATVESISGIAAGLESKLSGLRAQRQTLLGYLSPDAPDVTQLNIQISALERQLARENTRLASTKGLPLNRITERFQRLQLEAQFAQDVYSTALAALEKGRIDAARSIKKVSVLQSPTLPEYPMEPKRIYNITVFAIGVLVLAGIMHLFAAIIRDHRD